MKLDSLIFEAWLFLLLTERVPWISKVAMWRAGIFWCGGAAGTKSRPWNKSGSADGGWQHCRPEKLLLCRRWTPGICSAEARGKHSKTQAWRAQWWTSSSITCLENFIEIERKFEKLVGFKKDFFSKSILHPMIESPTSWFCDFSLDWLKLI